MKITRYKRGNIRSSDGKIFWAYQSDYANNEMWVTVERFQELKKDHRERYQKYKQKASTRYYNDKAKRNVYSYNYTKNLDPLKKLFNSAKGSSKSRRHGFNIKYEDIINLWEKQQGKCYYTNVSMLYENSVRSPYQVSLDRLDSNKTYSVDNIALCCISINYAKNNYELDIFKQFINNIKNN